MKRTIFAIHGRARRYTITACKWLRSVGQKQGGGRVVRVATEQVVLGLRGGDALERRRIPRATEQAVRSTGRGREEIFPEGNGLDVFDVDALLHSLGQQGGGLEVGHAGLLVAQIERHGEI